MSYWAEISARLASLGSASAAQIRAGLQEFDVRDIEAVRIAEDGGGGGGSMPWKHLVIPVSYTDIDEATGAAPIYELQPGEWLFLSWRVVTAVFNDTAAANNSAAILVPTGTTTQIDDSLSTQNLSADNAQDGLIGFDPLSTIAGFVENMLPGVAPATAAVQIDLDFTGGAPLAGDGTTGQLDQHLLILSAP